MREKIKELGRADPETITAKYIKSALEKISDESEKIRHLESGLRKDEGRIYHTRKPQKMA